jgi:hypothetical protein
MLCQGQIHFGGAEPISFVQHESLNLRVQVSVFKILEMRSAQTSAANLINASKI